MTYGVVTTVSGPVAMYDAVHAEISRRVGASIDGLLTHVGWATSDGFRVLEVWESKEHLDRFTRDVVGPVIESFGAPPAGGGEGEQGPSPQVAEVIDVRGLVLPGSGISW